MRTVSLIFALACSTPLALPQHATHGLLVDSASISDDGRVHIQWQGRNEQVMPRDRDAYCEDVSHCEDATASEIAISPDRTAVAWLAEYNGCCQSYPIPLVLVVARNGRIVKRLTAPHCIFGWAFERNGQRIALYSDFNHFNSAPYFALYDTRSWKRLADWSPAGNHDMPPGWVKPLSKWLP